MNTHPRLSALSALVLAPLFTAVALTLLLAACSSGEKPYDATGTFEATETLVAAEQSGVLLTFDVQEGDTLQAGALVAVVDTTALHLKLRQLQATKGVYRSQRPDTEKQVAATRQQIAKAQQERQRYAELVKDGAAPRKMLDDAESQLRVLQRQLEAQLSTLGTQISTLESQLSTADTQIDQLRDQLRKCYVRAPFAGTVLETYTERSEFATTGKPLFKLADLQEMYLRAYLTTAQLQQVKTGQAVKVMADYGNGQRRTYDGTVAWISTRSEFTPKSILTDDERADLVYAVKIRVKNDGYIKIGMYGEVKL